MELWADDKVSAGIDFLYPAKYPIILGVLTAERRALLAQWLSEEWDVSLGIPFRGRRFLVTSFLVAGTLLYV